MPRFLSVSVHVVAVCCTALLALHAEAQDKAAREPQATAAESLKVAEGFRVELLYSVPAKKHGSWVNICVDPKGRLIVSDQYGSLYRLTPPKVGTTGETKVERIPVDIGEAQGLLWAFDSLYVCVNRGQKYDAGLYRVRDTDGDDQFDSLEVLRKLNGRGEHGPHAVLPHPDGKSLVVVCGNGTKLTEISSSRVNRRWDEDVLLPRATGRFMVGVRAPGGFICRIDPDGKNWELLATGFRNEFDAAFDATGELFTYDADMEWDVNTPWYRPTRICHVVSGAEFGWRSGGGKWPTYYSDSLPAVIDIGPGSPTGVGFGYGTRFPAKYQEAFYACDWSYGKLYAVHLEQHGATFKAKAEEFVTGTPLPLTDLVANPHDGALYFLIGGRRVQSGFYRVTYTGDEPTGPGWKSEPSRHVRLRRALEKHHTGGDATTVDRVFPHLGHDDRFIRYAARTALEHRPLDEWQQRVLTAKDVTARIHGIIGIARVNERTDRGEGAAIDSPIPDWCADAPTDASRAALSSAIQASLAELDWNDLSAQQRLDYLRALTLTFLRIAPPNAAERQNLMVRLAASGFPSNDGRVNGELAQLMVYLQLPTAAELLVQQLEDEPTQEEQIGYAKTLRHLETGWNPQLQERYFRWFTRAAAYRGGASFTTFVTRIKEEAVAKLSEAEKTALEPILTAKPPAAGATAFATKPREFVKKWTMADALPLLETGLRNRDFDRGKKLFGAAACFACHRYDQQGGAVGPDLTSLAGRFSARDLLESIIEPSKQISDQYEAVTIETVEGKVITGRIANLNGQGLMIQTNMLDPGALVQVKRQDIEDLVPSKISMMPVGLLDTLDESEVLDLMAYLLSRGDRGNAMFKKDAGN